MRNSTRLRFIEAGFIYERVLRVVDKLSFVVLWLTKPRYRRGRATYIEVHAAVDPDDY